MSAGSMWKPGVLNNASDQMLRNETDKGLSRIYLLHNSLANAAVQGPDTGFRFNTGTETVTGSKIAIQTGLTTVDRVVATIDSGGTAFNEYITARPSQTRMGAVDIYVWRPTANNDVTPIASVTPWTVHWHASGS